MFFMKWWDPTTWLSDISGSVMGVIIKALRTLMYNVCTMIYQIIIILYKLFDALCNGRILDSKTIEPLIRRVGLILGIAMLFSVILAFIKMLIDPDTVNDKEKGAFGIVKRVLVVIVMLGTSTFIFETLYSVQSVVVNNNIIPKLFLPYNIDTENFGAALVAETFTTVYDVEENLKNSNNSDINYCQNVVYTLKDRIYLYSDFELGYACLNESVSLESDPALQGYSGDKQEVTIINFQWVVAIIVGIMIAYYLLSYSIAVGIRMVELAFLEVISPMAFISYLSPKKDNMFSNWLKTYLSTYLDVFIRIGIINFIFFLIAVILDSEGGWVFWKTVVPANSFTEAIICLTMIVALLSFAKKAPDLLKSLFPSSKSRFGGFHMKDALGLQRGLATIAGAGTGAAIGLLGGGLLGGMSGIFRGGRAGFGAKGVRNSFGAARKAQAEHNVAARLGQLPGFGDRFNAAIGAETTKEMYDGQIRDLEEAIQNEKVSTAIQRRQSAAYGQVSKAKGDIESRAESKLFNKNIDASKYSAMAQKQRNLLAARANVESLKNQGADKNIIASAERAYMSLLDQTKKDYITYAMQHEGFDAGMDNMLEDLKNTVNVINADGAFDGMRLKTNSYDDLDAFESSTTKLNGDLSRSIAISDANIQKVENDIQSIKNSQGYRDSHRIK